MSYVTLFMLGTLLRKVVGELEVMKASLKPCELKWEDILTHEAGCNSHSLFLPLSKTTNSVFSLECLFYFHFLNLILSFDWLLFIVCRADFLRTVLLKEGCLF